MRQSKTALLGGEGLAYNSVRVDTECSVSVAMDQSSQNLEEDLWLIDSGASDHLTGRREWFIDYEPIAPVLIRTANNQTMEAIGEGTIRLFTRNDSGGEKKSLLLQNVLYVPQCPKNLLSVTKFLGNGARIEITAQKILLQGGRKKKETNFGQRVGDLFYCTWTVDPPTHLRGLQANAIMGSSSVHSGALPLWHRRLGHLNTRDVLKLQELADGVKITNKTRLAQSSSSASSDSDGG